MALTTRVARLVKLHERLWTSPPDAAKRRRVLGKRIVAGCEELTDREYDQYYRAVMTVRDRLPPGFAATPAASAVEEEIS